ncbi:hypothetical protein PHYPO_G00026140 [Pangasianodon hypophthalmus]|uniref:G-protein coupled receptors family 1 profile domain-containing protein n=1 Tax=Pangasianodon hypophthalmus TaxID=310915 RepID=A0A5N5MVP4_PANHP|nr:hypothetical protein PHYPO_G00026140 [Pangasianodon hypophthalmus]
MERNDTAPSGACKSELECRAALDNCTGALDANLSVRCWLHLLTKEYDSALQGDPSSLALRVMIALVYSVVCALGLVGNALALYLLHSRHRQKQSSIDFFVMGLAFTDLQFVLTLPFWAVDTALDFRWPFGRVMCKIVSSVTTMNMYASVFFLTSMSVARHTATCCLLHHCPGGPDEELCLVRFPESGSWDPQQLLGLYQLQKVLLGFVIPLVVITLCYLLLLRFVMSRRILGSVSSETEQGRNKRRSKVTKSVVIVVLSFFLCWLPNQALTLWSVLIKFDIVPFSNAFYNAQAYAFPLSVCLAHTNSCLNPVLYCLIRREFRAGLKELVLRATPSYRSLAQLLPRKAKVAEAPTVLVLVQMDV